jgi:hypothetical protein
MRLFAVDVLKADLYDLRERLWCRRLFDSQLEWPAPDASSEERLGETTT